MTSMKYTSRLFLAWAVLPILLARQSSAFASTIVLRGSWQIQDSNLVTATPQVVATPGFSTQSWIPATVPQTVMAALVAQKDLEFDPFFGTNLLRLPGSGAYYSAEKNFGTMTTPQASPFGRPWYYRTEFRLPSRNKLALNKYLRKRTRSPLSSYVNLHLGGATYGAEIYLNGNKIADASQTAGTYRTPDFDITPFVHEGINALAILVGPSQPGDLTASWVDWNPTPQDKNMGLWQEVSLNIHGPVAINHPQVVTKLVGTVASSAALTVETDLINSSNEIAQGILSGTIGAIEFSQLITLQPNETRTIQFLPATYPQLVVANPELWWPWQMGRAAMHTLNLNFKQSEKVSDSASLRFGIREITSELNSAGSRLFRINQKPVLIRGGGWASDLFLRFSKTRAEKELQYVKDLGLNTIRLEGRFEPDEFLQMTDQAGILVMTGWVCCNAWQEDTKWPAASYEIAASSLRDQIYAFRAHPSVLAFLYGSDQAPSAAVEKMYLDTFDNYHWPNPKLSSAADSTTPYNGSTGFKMNGPYDYTPPSYWLTDTDKEGGAWGFNTETTPGPSIPVLESLQEFIPAEHLWPIDEVWNFHAGQLEFHNLNKFQKSLATRYGEPKSLEDFEMKSQVMGYDNHRAMFEAFNRNKYKPATGIIQWMLNNSWPSLIWHLYDYYLRTGGAYFGVKKANQPLHLIYSYNDQAIFLVNQLQTSYENLQAKVDVFDFQMKPLYHKQVLAKVDSDSAVNLMTLPNLKNLTRVYFVKLSLADAQGMSIDENFYWLSTQKEIFDWNETDFKSTPLLQEADLKLLQTLPKTYVQTDAQIDSVNHTATVKLTNLGTALAFFVHVKLIHESTNKEIIPSLWQDNYITLLPGKSRTLSADYGQADLNRSPVEVQTNGWNLAPLESFLN